MSSWLAPVIRALDERPGPVHVFFRDDDAGWSDDRLFPLLDVFAAHECPIDLAVIPTALREELAAALLDRKRAGCAIGLHQHGFSHQNHERSGRPCEFGLSRPAALQARDIQTGQRLLREHFGDHLDSIFTPPWNRCVAETGASLVKHGFAAISRDTSAGVLNIDALTECPIRLDWCTKSKGSRLSREAWAVLVANHVAGAASPLGIMLHHAVMDSLELEACEQIVRIVTTHRNVRLVPMRHIATATASLAERL